MKKLVFGLILGFALSFGVNVNAAEINGKLTQLFDSPTGGVVQTLNKDSIINTQLGEASGNTDNIGGTLILYNGLDNKRVTAGTSKLNDAGHITTLDKNNKIRAGMLADSNDFGPIVFVANSNGFIRTYLTPETGFINGKMIITEDYLRKNYVSKDNLQIMIDDAVQKALTK